MNSLGLGHRYNSSVFEYFSIGNLFSLNAMNDLLNHRTRNTCMWFRRDHFQVRRCRNCQVSEGLQSFRWISDGSGDPATVTRNSVGTLQSPDAVPCCTILFQPVHRLQGFAAVYLPKKSLTEDHDPLCKILSYEPGTGEGSGSNAQWEEDDTPSLRSQKPRDLEKCLFGSVSGLQRYMYITANEPI